MLKRWRIRILLFLAVLGPGFITANIDNDSGGILTYSNAGAQFGYTLLWTMIPITVALLVVQEMCARMGAVTGKGLSDLIREEFGLRMTFHVDAAAGDRQLRQRHDGVRRHCRQHAAVPRQQIHLRARQRLVDLAPGGQGRLQAASKRSFWRRRFSTLPTSSPAFFPSPAGTMPWWPRSSCQEAPYGTLKVTFT